jgi:ribosome-binding ATPase YchF (GTP1/OBG family)
VISAEIEAEVAQLPDEEQAEFLAELGLTSRASNRSSARATRCSASDLLHRRPQGDARLDHPQGRPAPQAAGVIHTDFERGFIRAQTIAYDDFVTLGGEVAAKEAGKARDEGKEYVVKDGDVMLFKFNT